MSAEATAGSETTTPFHDLGDFVAIPRIGALRLSPDGSWLAAAIQTLSADGKKYLTSMWRIDSRRGQARRLTRSAEGEANPLFLPEGSLLFTSKRPDPGADKARQDGAAPDVASLWLLPAGEGEARPIIRLPGGIAGVEAASQAGTIVVTSSVLPTARTDNTADDDARLRKERADAGVTAILHESSPIRFWDHDLGPDQLRLFAIEPGQGGQGGRAVPPSGGSPGGRLPGESTAVPPSGGSPGGRPLGESTAVPPSGGSPGGRPPGENTAADEPAGVRDLTPEPGRALDDQAFELTPDGTSVLTGWWLWNPAGQSHSELVTIDVATGKRRILLSAPEFNFSSPRVSPDGRFVVCQRETRGTAERPLDMTLVLLGINGADVSGGSERDLLPSLDRWPLEPTWTRDSREVYFVADDDGRRPVFRVEVASGAVTRVTGDGAYSELNLSRDGRYLYALRATVGSPPTPVRIDLNAQAGEADPVPLDGPGVRLTVPGRVEEVEAAADDGNRIRGWLVLPETASADSPAPLLLWVHGGPMSSWNSWSWRWNPWLMAARGYAVLLPDPALSTGYGQEFIVRAHREWGARPYADVMAVTDAVVARPDIDADRVAMMGGSYGGYMANWMAGHTDRFRAIVSHAGLWALDQMFGTTDHPMFWRPQFGDPLRNPGMYELNSPHLHVDQIRTPMLVIHGNRDYRVPVGEALRLWWDLSRHGVEAKFLYFPDENHWILTPGNARIWYETVFAFLAQHVLGQPWERPALL